MLPKTVHSLSRPPAEIIPGSFDAVRSLSLAEVRDLLHFARLRLLRERLPQVAGSLTFTTTLALVPLLTIVLAMFTSFPMFANLRVAMLSYFEQIMLPPVISNTIIANLTLFARQATGLSALGAVTLVFTCVAMMGMIERAFNQIWRVKTPRPPVQRITIYWALVTLGPLMFGLSMTVTSQLFVATGSLVQAAPILASLFYTGVSVALTTAAYTLLYVCLPNRFVHWRDAACGALVAALAFEVAKRLFGMFVRQFPSYAIIYGALAALPVFLVWIYVSWLITLVGALLAAALPVIKYERWWYQPVPGGAFVDAMAILKILYRAGRMGESALVSSSLIRSHTRIGYDEMTALLDRMVAAGWVGRVRAGDGPRSRWGKRVRDSDDSWVLLSNPSRLRVADVYRLFVFGGAGAPAQHAASPLALDTAALARQVEAAVERGLDQTLAEHFGERPANQADQAAPTASCSAASTAPGCSAII